LLQPQVDNPAHTFERSRQFATLRFGRVRILLAAPRHLLANQSLTAFLRAFEKFEALH
jgi:hypothetical protein